MIQMIVENYPKINLSYIDEICAPIISVGDNIKDYYLITNYGVVYNANTGGEIIPHENHNGYYQVSLMSNGPTERIYRKVHRLVMMTFYYFPGCENFQVNHKNGNKKDNSYHNLEWVTVKENAEHSVINNLRGPRSEREYIPLLSEEQVREVVRMIIDGESDDYIINTVCNYNVQAFRSVIYGKEWDHIISKEERRQIYLSRTAYALSLQDKHALCKFFQDNKYIYDHPFDIMKAGLRSIGKDPDLVKNMSSAAVLYYKRKCPDITSLYDF